MSGIAPLQPQRVGGEVTFLVVVPLCHDSIHILLPLMNATEKEHTSILSRNEKMEMHFINNPHLLGAFLVPATLLASSHATLT